MAGGRNSGTYCRFACCGAGNKVAAISSTSTRLTACRGFACSSHYAGNITQGTSEANTPGHITEFSYGSYSGFARYDAKVTTRTTTPNYA